ncbi:hypothetical protein V6N12_023991 [Hibiscus sabdariffa]|uniref:RNase H type-1 domain-containing protein n=1 Tax=Hibiscus sabdariffa TaxID=183260 RepID=A0ABR2FZH5_9ROSI
MVCSISGNDYSWVKSQVGWVKANADRLLACRMRRRRVEGVYEILMHAWPAGFCIVVVKKDNVDVFKILEGKSPASSDNTVVESTKYLPRLDWEVRSQHIGRMQNKVTDALTVASRDKFIGEWIYITLPVYVKDFLIQEC